MVMATVVPGVRTAPDPGFWVSTFWDVCGFGAVVVVVLAFVGTVVGLVFGFVVGGLVFVGFVFAVTVADVGAAMSTE
jgi:hypothetical protein